MDGRILLIVVATAAIVTHGRVLKPGNIQTIPGAIKEAKGTVFPVSAFVDIKVSLEPLHEFVDELHRMANSIQTMIDNIFQYTGPNEHFKILSPALQRLKFKVSSYTDRAYTPRNTSRTRTRRGLFDFVGVISNQLFGIIDTKSLENRLEEFNGRQASVTKTINANSRALSTLAHNVQQLKDATSHFHSIINERLTSTDVFAELAFMTTQYELTFMEVTSSASSFQNAVLAAAEGRVTKDLISQHDIRKLIHTMKSTHDLRPLFKPGQYMLLYSCLSSYLTQDGVSILLPLQPPATLRAYQIHPFPLFLNSSSTHVTLDALKIILAPHPTRVVSQTHAIALPSQNLDDTCHTPAPGIYVCMAPLWPYFTNTSSCAQAIILHSHNIHAACSFSKIIPSKRPFTVASLLQTIFYFYLPTPATITCNDSVPHPPLQGAFVLPRSCSLSCVAFSFPAIKHFHTTFHKNLQFPNPAPLPSFPSSLLTSFNLTLSTVEVPAPLPPFVHHHRAFAYGYPIATSIGVVFLLTVVMLLVMCCARQINMGNSPNRD